MRLAIATGFVMLIFIAAAVAQRPRFEVASIKACGAADPGFRGGGPTEFLPNPIAVDCQILKGLIQQAYIANANGRIDQSAVLRTPIEDGPDWISSERYSITDLSRDELDAARWPLARSPFLLETTRPGVFAVGDVRAANIKRVASAVGEGSIAIAFVHQVLQRT